MMVLSDVDIVFLELRFFFIMKVLMTFPHLSYLTFLAIFCDSLAPSLNGVIRQSDGDLLNSVATYSCDMNYELQGSANRTCVIIGKTTAWSGTAPSCMTGKY